MKIKKHWLTSDAFEIKHLKKVGKSTIKPEIIVIHYGVTHSLSSLVAAQRSRGYWAHLSIDGYVGDTKETPGTVYEVTQALPFNHRGSHAGKSEYNGKKWANGFSVGIEIANPGPLIRGKDGKLRTVYRKVWEEDQAIKAKHSYKWAPKKWDHWAIYTDQEIDLCVEICHLLKKAYPSIKDVVGHDDIAPGRKFDPGPAFPMEYLRNNVFRF